MSTTENQGGVKVAARGPTDQKPSMLHPAGGREEEEEEAAPAAAVMESRERGGEDKCLLVTE